MGVATRTTFHVALEGLWAQMAALAHLDARAVEQASAALLDADGRLAQLVIRGNADITAVGNDLEDQAMQLLALQSPVASDLRLVISIFPLASALTRMGGLARHIARLAVQRSPQAVVVEETMRVIAARMGETAQRMALDLTTALAVQDTPAARSVEESDQRMDDLYRDLLTRARDTDRPIPVEAAVDAALLGRFYERFADQAVDAARRIQFVLTGIRPDPP